MNRLALAYGVGAIVNILWPRSPNDPWYSNYAMLVTTVGVVVLGGFYMATARPYEHGQAPAGDAHRLRAGRVRARRPSVEGVHRGCAALKDRVRRSRHCPRRRSNWRR